MGEVEEGKRLQTYDERNRQPRQSQAEERNGRAVLTCETCTRPAGQLDVLPSLYQVHACCTHPSVEVEGRIGCPSE